MTAGEPAPDVVAGLAVHRRPSPGAARVVLVHGSMDRSASFVKVGRRLRDLDLVRYDRRGYGRSRLAGVADGIDGQVADLCAVLGGGPAVVVGHSLGGLIALVAAERHPDLVLAVGAFEAPMPWAPWWPTGSAGSDAFRAADELGPEAAAERFMRRMIGDERWERLPPSTRSDRRAEGAALLAELRAARADGAPYDPAALAGTGVPVVAGFGTATDAQHRRGTTTLAAQVAGSELVAVAGARHGAHSSHPDAFAAFVRRAVRRAGGGAAAGRSRADR